MSNKHLLVKAHIVSEDSWWYEEPRGIDVHVDVRNFDGYFIRHVSVLIPWSQIENALKRKRKK